MMYNRLAKTDLKISAVSFGCMSLDLRRSDNIALLRKAHELGINYFDTADLYDQGANEVLVGRALRPIRENVVIATKVGNEWLPDGKSWRWNTSKSHLQKAVDQSLKRLQTDYIDLYQLHGGTMEDDMEEIISSFENFKKAGKIRHYGISSIRPNVIREYTDKSNMVSDMLQYSLLDRRPEEEILDYLHSHQVGVMVRGALAKGLLAGKKATEYLNYSQSEVEKLQLTLHELTNQSRTVGQLAVSYVLAHAAVTTAVIGIRTEDQLKEARKISDSPAPTQSELDQLASCLPLQHYTQHR